MAGRNALAACPQRPPASSTKERCGSAGAAAASKWVGAGGTAIEAEFAARAASAEISKGVASDQSETAAFSAAAAVSASLAEWAASQKAQDEAEVQPLMLMRAPCCCPGRLKRAAPCERLHAVRGRRPTRVRATSTCRDGRWKLGSMGLI